MKTLIGGLVVNELWLNDHERVVLIDTGNGVLLSYDVYCNGWNYPTDYKIGINDRISLVYHRISGLEGLPESIVWIELVGVVSDTRQELVNVRVFVKDEVSEVDAKKILGFLKDSVLRQCNSIS